MRIVLVEFVLYLWTSERYKIRETKRHTWPFFCFSGLNGNKRNHENGRGVQGSSKFRIKWVTNSNNSSPHLLRHILAKGASSSTHLLLRISSSNFSLLWHPSSQTQTLSLSCACPLFPSCWKSHLAPSLPKPHRHLQNRWHRFPNCSWISRWFQPSSRHGSFWG